MYVYLILTGGVTVENKTPIENYWFFKFFFAKDELIEIQQKLKDVLYSVLSRMWVFFNVLRFSCLQVLLEKFGCYWCLNWQKYFWIVKSILKKMLKLKLVNKKLCINVHNYPELYKCFNVAIQIVIHFIKLCLRMVNMISLIWSPAKVFCTWTIWVLRRIIILYTITARIIPIIIQDKLQTMYRWVFSEKF